MAIDAQEGTLLWEPSPEFKQRSRITAYMRWLDTEKDLHFADYQQLWRWSVSELEQFWVSIAEFFDVRFSQPWSSVLSSHQMPGAKWFEGARLNYSENVFRHRTDEQPALLFQSELRPLDQLSWSDLEAQVAAIAATLRTLGVGRGDRVVAYLPNIPEAMVAFLATASLGAIWSSCSPDFGIGSVVDRFGQIEPKVLFAVDGYSYAGKAFDRLSTVRELQAALPTVQKTILVPYLQQSGTQALSQSLTWSEALQDGAARLEFEQVPFDHPLWVLYSSGTTGLPKAIVHGHGGVVLEQTKVLALHHDLGPGDRLFWYTSTGWMMWNFVAGGLLVGATPVLYDGNPTYPSLDVLWEFAQTTGITLFGTSAAYIMNCLKAGIQPGTKFDLRHLKSIGSTGSPLPPEGFGWAYEAVKRDLWLASISGGTDVVTGFVVSCPLLPVHAGELQCAALGADVQSFDENGKPLVGELGELVITQPMPSMPVSFWNDPDGKRYRESYFEAFPGVWRHGDWIKFTSRGSAVIQGRSDATLNRQGVRIGSSEIYTAVESLPEVLDSLVIGVELPGGDYYMPLFVVLDPSAQLDDSLKARIKKTLRESCSPRHVPDEIMAVPAIPRTLSNKKMEVPIKKLFMGVPLSEALTVGATTDPSAVEHFARLAEVMSPLSKLYHDGGARS